MPSTFDQDYANSTAVDLLDVHGESVTRITSDGTRDTFTGIADVFPQEWNEFDKVWEQRGFVEVASATPAERADKWEVGDVVFKVEKLGADRRGMRRIDLIRQVKTGARP